MAYSRIADKEVSYKEEKRTVLTALGVKVLVYRVDAPERRR